MIPFLLCFGLIRFLGGKPRGGKSFRALMMVVKVLRDSRQPIVTNLAIKLDDLQEYCDRHEIRVNVLQRITILDKDQTKRFWRFRGYDLELAANLDGSNKHKKTGEVLPNEQQPLELAPIYGPDWQDEKICDPDAGDAYRKLGVCYVIDEAHMHFGSRYWERTEDEALWYASQHGKLGDTVWFVTQSISNVVKQLRDLAQDYTYCRNLRKEKRGWFKAGDYFVATTHLRVQQPGATEDDPIEKETYKFDAELMACYDTSAGVGVPGGGKGDRGEKVKGLPLWSVWVGFAAAFLVLWVGMGYAPRLLGYGLKKAAGIEDTVAKAKPLERVGIVRPSDAAMAEAHQLPSPALETSTAPVTRQQTASGEPLWVTGVIGRRVGSTWMVNVMLSDGRTLTEGDGTLAKVERASVVLADGARVYMKRIPSGSGVLDRATRANESPASATRSDKTEPRQAVGKDHPAQEPPERPTLEKRTG